MKQLHIYARNVGVGMTRRQVLALVGMVILLLALNTAIVNAQDEISSSVPFEQPETWNAGETSVSGLSMEEKRSLVGIPLDVLAAEIRQGQAAASERPSTKLVAPDAIDWRNHMGEDWTTPIRNQAGCGSCVAFGTIAAIESRMEIVAADSTLEPDLSEGQLFYCGCGECCDYGWTPTAGMEYALFPGLVDEDCQPYSDVTQTCSLCPDWETRITRIADYRSLFDDDLAKEAIAYGGPVQASMTVFEDFYWYLDGVYRHEWGDGVGGHCISLVGYDDEGGYWIAKNSWGTGWGEDGWFRIAYGENIWANYAPLTSCEDVNEPNDAPGQATPLAYGENTYGGICFAYDEDYFVFDGIAGDHVQADVEAFSIGSTLGAGLTLYDQDGVTVLAEAIAEGNTDPHLTYVLPATGSYYLKVTEALSDGHAGIDSFYSLHLQLAPDLVVTGLPIDIELELVKWKARSS